MTVVICANEHNLMWVFDDRFPHRWGGRPQTPTGEYLSIAAAFVGDCLEVVYMQETGSDKILLIDPGWAGMLSYLGTEVHHSQEDDWLLSHYPDFASPYAEQLKLAVLDYAQAYNRPNFITEAFISDSCRKYGLRQCQVKTAINYAKRIGCRPKNTAAMSFEQFATSLDWIFDRIKAIKEMYFLPIIKEINFDDPAMVAAVLGSNLAPTPTPETRQLTQFEIDMRYFMEGIDLSQLD